MCLISRRFLGGKFSTDFVGGFGGIVFGNDEYYLKHEVGYKRVKSLEERDGESKLARYASGSTYLGRRKQEHVLIRVIIESGRWSCVPVPTGSERI